MSLHARFDADLEAERLRSEAFVDDEVPVDLEAICEALDIRIEHATHADPRVAGSSSVERRQGIIRLRPGLDRGLMRFTLAHELGHHRLHIGHSCQGGDSSYEREADAFASALLFPRKTFQEDLWHLGQRVSLTVVEELARRYETSLSAAANRFARCHSEIVAHVVATFDEMSPPKVRYVFESEEFKALGLRIQWGAPLPRNANATAYIEKGVIFTNFLPAKHWFPDADIHQQQRLYEEVRLSRGLKEAHILLWIPELREA